MRTNTVFMIVITFLPFLTYAGVDINNHTDFYGTGNVKNGSCSSELGDRGIIKPHGKLSLNTAEIIYLCGYKTCETFLFLTNNCTGEKLATVKMNAYKGVQNIINHKPTEYVVSGGGSSITIDAQKFNFKNWLKSWVMFG